MKKYDIIYSNNANNDLENLAYAIAVTYKSPLTSFRYVQGIINTINKLRKNPEIYPIRFNQTLMQYGLFVRRVNYKKMAIIYTINNHTVTIQRVIASSLILNYL
jgi:plasmid stabilization system protein ParE